MPALIFELISASACWKDFQLSQRRFSTLLTCEKIHIILGSYNILWVFSFINNRVLSIFLKIHSRKHLYQRMPVFSPKLLIIHFLERAELGRSLRSHWLAPILQNIDVIMSIATAAVWWERSAGWRISNPFLDKALLILSRIHLFLFLVFFLHAVICGEFRVQILYYPSSYYTFYCVPRRNYDTIFGGIRACLTLKNFCWLVSVSLHSVLLRVCWEFGAPGWFTSQLTGSTNESWNSAGCYAKANPFNQPIHTCCSCSIGFSASNQLS